MLSQQIRRRFLGYFEQKGHTLVPSSPVIPHDDPTLLFINAGMNQFKDVFLGKAKRDYMRATSSQKCIRVGGKHNDLENVGHTARHLTFFEMLGNFSFGDYFKKEAIDFAWEITLQVYGFDPEFLWATVFHEDEEAFELWTKYLPEKRIIRMGEKDNFWAMGDVGPCGPCSELYFDKGQHFGNARTPAEDIQGERFLEFWNLVFMQFNRDRSGELQRLPKQSVDTGSGLERVISLIMGVESVFETDVLRSLIAKTEEITGIPYRKQPPFHVIADHIRSLSFAMADGVQPSNLDRGYVLRKILRRAVRYGRQLGLNRPFLAELLPTLIHQMGDDFPELKTSQSLIEEQLTREEEAFLRTLTRGGNILNQVIANSTANQLISGDDAFKLKDTYGLPLEEILLLAKDAHLGVDIQRFEDLEHEAKERSRGARKVSDQVAETSLYEDYVAHHGECPFVGYEQLTCEAVVLGLLKGGKLVDTLYEGEEGLVLLSQTPFYAERGGQVGDQGSLQHQDVLFEVTDCQTPYSKVITHHGLLKKGELHVGDPIEATVDPVRRLRISNHHTATHVLHWALTEVLGAHVKQAGSIVEADHFRFDFNHPKALTKEQILLVEERANEKIRENLPVHTYELSYQEVQKHPEIKQFFGEKYGARVRVVDMEFSKELCGGTHAKALGCIGYFRITKESSIAAGVRRVEVVTGAEADQFARGPEQVVLQLSALLAVQPSQLIERIEKLVSEQRALQTHLATLQRGSLQGFIQTLKSQITSEKGIPRLLIKTEIDPGQLKALSDGLFEQHPSLLLLILNAWEEKCHFLARVSPDLKLSAGDLIKTLAPTLGGKGGGKPDFAQGGGTMPQNIPLALEQAHQWISSKVS